MSGIIVRVQHILTLAYAQLTHGEVIEASAYAVNEVSHRVYWYSADTKRAGHCTPLNTILLNRMALKEVSPEMTEYVFLHEVGHAQEHFLIRILKYGLYFTSGSIIISTIIGLPALTIRAILGDIPPQIVLSVAMIFLFTVLLASTVSWFDEIHAELFALKNLGEKVFFERQAEIDEIRSRSVVRRILFRIRYPPNRLVLWIAEKS